MAITSLGHQLALPLTCIGHINAGSGLLVLDENGSDITPARRGYDHFHE
jgi:thiamine-monophosphate kinase